MPLKDLELKFPRLFSPRTLGEYLVHFNWNFKNKVFIGRCEKLTKINILHVTINYIRALESIIDTGDAGVQVYGTSIVQSPHLPIPPDIEQPAMEKVAKITPSPKTNHLKSVRRGAVPKKSQTTSTRTKNPSASSSSEDSGINMDEEDQELDKDAEEPDEEICCPDWTELTSTLEFFPNTRGNLDTLLSSTTVPRLPNCSSSSSSKILQPKDLNFKPDPDLKLTGTGGGIRFADQTRFNLIPSLDLDTIPLEFGDLNSSFDSSSLESSTAAGGAGASMIPFEEPFELVF